MSGRAEIKLKMADYVVKQTVETFLLVVQVQVNVPTKTLLTDGYTPRIPSKDIVVQYSSSIRSLSVREVKLAWETVLFFLTPPFSSLFFSLCQREREA